MDGNPALWADVARDLATARRHVADAAARARTLEISDGGPTAEDARLDRESAISAMLHHCYGAMESALERLIEAVDGSRPTGSAYRAEIVRRASSTVPGLRPAMITAETAADLQRLRASRHAFRHAYDGYDHRRAAENVPLAERAVPRFEAELTAFARAAGIRP